MALTNQPYLPLYINDWLSSTKLKSCSAVSHGIMINVMALMHKEDSYGIILLKQKFKQTDKQLKNFALQLAKILPFDTSEILGGLGELIEEGCLILEGDNLCCKRMIKDADISLKRSLSGSKGGQSTMQKPKTLPKKFAQAKTKANTEIENEIEFENVDEKIKESFGRWIKYKIERKENYKSDDSRRTAFRKLIKFSGEDGENAHLIIDSAIGNNYSGFFELSARDIQRLKPVEAKKENIFEGLINHSK